jgi:hypothetical protein
MFILDMSIEQNLLINIVDQIVLLDESFSSNGKLIYSLLSIMNKNV